MLRTSRHQALQDVGRRPRASFDLSNDDFLVSSVREPGGTMSTPACPVHCSVADASRDTRDSRMFQRTANVQSGNGIYRGPWPTVDSGCVDRRAISPSRSPPPTLPERKAAIKVDKYDGTTCIETFLFKFENTARYNQWRDRDKAAHLAAALSGSAGLILWNLPDPTYVELVARLRQRYGSTSSGKSSDTNCADVVGSEMRTYKSWLRTSNVWQRSLTRMIHRRLVIGSASNRSSRL
jgi:hypothetical protein